MSTLQRVIKIIEDQVGNRDIQSDTKLDYIGTDSLDEVEIVMLLEEDFSIELHDDALETLVTVQDIVDLVDSPE